MVGLINVQYAIRDGVVYVLEVNPRASRTVPFVSKATGVPFARLAARLMARQHARRAGRCRMSRPSPGVAVKEAVFPFNKFDVDIILGPEMRSTGEVMGFDDSFGMAFAKAQISAGNALPHEGAVMRHGQRPRQAERHADRCAASTTSGFSILATGARTVPARARDPGRSRCSRWARAGPNIVDTIISGEVRTADQHAARQEVAVRRLRDAARRDHVQGAILHHDVGRIGRVRRRNCLAFTPQGSEKPAGTLRLAPCPRLSENNSKRRESHAGASQFSSQQFFLQLPLSPLCSGPDETADPKPWWHSRCHQRWPPIR